MKTFYKNIYRNTLLLSLLLAVSLSSACVGVAQAPAPVDDDVVGLFAGTTRWILDQASRGVKVVGLRAYFDQVRQWVVIGTPFQQGYGMVLLDAKTWQNLDDPEVLKSLSGGYVNCKTWTEFTEWLLANGFVEQMIVAGTSISQTWYTIVIGTVIMPSEIVIDDQIIDWNMPGIDPEGYLEYKE